MSQSDHTALDPAADVSWLQRLPMIAGGLALVLVLGYVFAFKSLPLNEKPDAWGQFGDYVGGILNPLISLFTLVVAVSVWKLQKTELLETRRAVEEQGKTAEQQRREQRFFDLLNLYQETMKTFVVGGSTGKAALNNWSELFSPHSLDCVTFLNAGWEKFYDPINRPRPSLSAAVEEAMNPCMTTFSQDRIRASWSGVSPLLDHYFRIIFAILGELEKLLGGDHWRYAKLFRAQLSRDELTLLAFNLLFDDEGLKMRPLVYKYGLLKHLATNKLREHAIAELAPAAFGLGSTKARKAGSNDAKSPC